MAKAIEKLQVRLEVAGLEDLAKLKGSFRSLGQAVAPADAALSDARKAVLDFAASSKQSVQLIEGQIQAFKGLRAQAAAGGGLYRQLTGDIKRLESASYGASEAIEQQRKQLTAVGTSANATVPQIKQAVSALIGLRTETRTDSDAFNKFGQSISAVSSNLRQVTADTQAYSDARKRSAQAMAAESGAAKQQLKDTQLLVQTLRQQRDELGALQGQERIRRGLADLVDKGEVSSGTRTYEDIIASSLFGEFKAITTAVLPAKDIQKAVEEVKSQLQELQKDIERNIARGLQRSFQETAREARESARAAAQAFSSPEFLAVFNNLTKRLGELPQTAAGFSQRLRELQQVFANTAVSAENYVTIALEIARVQREASAATQGLGAALVRDLDAGVAARSQKNLQEAIGQLKQEMLELDTTTTAGARAYAENANQVRVLERQLKQLAEAYRNVADVAPRAAGAQGGVSPFLPSGARNPNYVSPQQAAAAETQAQLDEELKNLIQESNEHRKREIQTRIENLRAINAENEARREQAAIDRSIRKGQARIAANQPPVQLSALEQNREAVLTQLALQGRELSSFYEGIVNLGTASTRRQQAMMGRTGTEVLTDIFTAFNRGGQAAVNQQENRRLSDNAADTANNVTSTFSASLKNGASKMAAAAKAAFDRVTQTINDVFGIASPSRFIIELVQNLASTYVSQLQKEYPRIREATQRAFGDLPTERPVRQLTATGRGFEFVDRPSTGYRPLPTRSFEPSGAGGEMDEMLRRFRYQIAQLTTQPEIYRNILNALPSSALTTDLAALASERARGAEMRGFMDVQRQLGPGELERYIQGQLAEALKGIRIPNPWVGPIGDYKKFIEAVTATTKKLVPLLSGGKIPLALPPATSGQIKQYGPLATTTGRARAAIPPAFDAASMVVDVTASAVKDAELLSGVESKKLSEKVREFFAQLFDGMRVAGQRAAVSAKDFVLGFRPIGSSGGGATQPPAPPRPPRTGAGAAPLPPPPEPTAYQRLTKAVEGFGLASDRSTQDLREFLSTLRSTADILDPTAADFAKVNRVIEQQGRLIERELERRQRTVRRFSAGQLAQTAGAALSGAVFGGPEGFLGGVVGGIAGGPGGAFAGAAAGAQVAMLRQAAGGAAEYAAAINQQRRALEGVVEDNAAYQQSLAFIDQTSRQLAIPQEQVTRNFTRLSASVLGAGGNVDAAQEAFMGISAGIRGTGGSLADLDAALLATAQIFSKGKVSAEELRGQIGERLPGAFTLFAESIGKTPQQLDKMLEKGEVGLNDFMAFVRRLSSEYGASADTLAKSSESAGDRLATAFGRIQEAIGKAFQPVGAEFQEALVRFVTENEQALVGLAQSMAGVGKGFLDFVVAVGPALVELGKFALAFGAATLALKAFTAALPALRAAMVLLQAQFGQMTAQAAAAQTRLVAFGATVKALAASLAAPIVLTIAIVGITKVLEDLNRVKRTRQELAELPDPVEDVGRAYGNRVTAADRSRLITDMEETSRQISAQKDKVAQLRAEYEKANRTATVTGFAARTFNVIGRAGRQAAEDEYRTAVKRLDALNERQRLLGARMGQIGTGSPTESSFQFPSSTAEAAGAKEKKGPQIRESRLVDLQIELAYQSKLTDLENERARAAENNQRLTLIDLDTRKANLDIEKQLKEARLALQQEVLKGTLTQQMADQEYAAQEAIAAERRSQASIASSVAINRLRDQDNEQVRSAVTAAFEYVKQQKDKLAYEREYGELMSSGVLPSVAKELLEVKKITAEKELQLELEIQRLAAEEGTEKQVEGLREALARLRKENAALIKEAGTVNNVKIVNDALTATKGELNELTNLGNIVVNSANAIGDAFGQAFRSITSGAASTKEVLAEFFQNVANAFLDMAAQIIAKQVVMVTLQAILKALGGAGGGNMAAVDKYASTSSPETMTDVPILAKGGVFSPQGHVERYAQGGVVTAPTMFRFAKGSGFAPGLMGEAGPEAILPLQRTPSGDLGVRATLQVPYASKGNQDLQVPYTRAGEQYGTMTGDGMIRFESTVINNQEFVTKDEAERIGQAAASRGAEIAQRRMKNSPQVRRSLGIA